MFKKRKHLPAHYSTWAWHGTSLHYEARTSNADWRNRGFHWKLFFIFIRFHCFPLFSTVFLHLLHEEGNLRIVSHFFTRFDPIYCARARTKSVSAPDSKVTPYLLQGWRNWRTQKKKSADNGNSFLVRLRWFFWILLIKIPGKNKHKELRVFEQCRDFFPDRLVCYSTQEKQSLWFSEKKTYGKSRMNEFRARMERLIQLQRKLLASRPLFKLQVTRSLLIRKMTRKGFRNRLILIHSRVAICFYH